MLTAHLEYLLINHCMRQICHFSDSKFNKTGTIFEQSAGFYMKILLFGASKKLDHL